jgi:4-amino-4-deoxy-L-arabinose transferase-like glycosyltransferase
MTADRPGAAAVPTARRVRGVVERRHIALAAALGLALRLAFGLFYWVDKPMTHDEQEYLALAAALAQGRGFSYTQPPAGTTAQFGRAPGYPAFLAAIGAGTTTATSAPTRVKVAQAILGALAVCLIAGAAWYAAGPTAGIVAAWLAAGYPPLVWISSYVFSESLYTVLALSTALALQAAVDRGNESVRRPALAGTLGGAAILVRPAMLFFVPLAVIWLVWWRRAPRVAAAFVLGALVVVAPWTIRNYRTYGRFVLVASEGGVTFWTGNHPLSRGEGDLAANPELKHAELEFRRAHPGLTSEELEPLYYREAIRHITSAPLWWVGLLARKVFYTVVPTGPSYGLHSWRYRAASVISYLVLLPFALAGAVVLRRSPRRPAGVLLLAAAAVLVGLIFFPQERFRIPVIDPVLIVCAATYLSTRLMGRSLEAGLSTRPSTRPIDRSLEAGPSR